jgi:hypothetical protein
MFSSKQTTWRNCSREIRYSILEVDKVRHVADFLSRLNVAEHGPEPLAVVEDLLANGMIAVRDQQENILRKNACYAVLHIGEQGIKPLCDFKQCPFYPNGPAAELKL